MSDTERELKFAPGTTRALLDRVAELERLLGYWSDLARSLVDARDRLEAENARLRDEFADAEKRLARCRETQRIARY